MSLNTRIGDPFTLATLTKPVSSTNGRAHAAGVCGLSGIKKRKRTELAVGLDGEGVSIYSLQTPQLVTSYALPSSATFTTAPYSVYRKGSARTPSHRYTYASVTKLAQSDKLQLVCFHDRVVGDKTETSKTTYTPSSNARVLALDVLPVAPGGSSRDATHDLLAAFDNGDIVCLAADLDTVRWVANLRSLIPGADLNTQLDHFSTATARAVARGMLRGREDLSAILLPSTGEESSLPDLTQVLCVLSHHAAGATALTLVQIQSRSADLNTPLLSPLKTLVSWHLPGPAADLITTSPPHYALHAATGVLHIVASSAILSYSFSGITPKLTSKIRVPGLDVESFLRLSPDTILTFAEQSLRLLDVKFGSLQATHSVQESATSDPASPAKKKKNAHSENKKLSQGNYHLVAYHADANLIVALQENEIIGMQYDSSSARKRRKLEGTSLLEALGKGMISQPVVATQNLENFEDRKKKFDRYVAKGKIGKFEHAFASDLCIELESISSEVKQENEVNGGPLTNGVGPKIPDEDAMALDKEIEGEGDELSRWRMPKHVPDYRRPQYDQYALYALSKIFVHASAEESKKSGSGLKIQFFPPNVFQWLLLTGHLTKESIRRSIDQEKAEATTISAVTDKDVIKALVEFDPDLHILSEILNGDQHLPLAAVVHVIKLLMQSLDDQLESAETTETPKPLTNGTSHHEEMDVDIDSELEAATHEIDHAMSILNQGLLTRSNTLRPALIRLHRFSPPFISSTLRSTLSRRDLETLIRLLHSEMKNGGWSMTYEFIDALAEGTADAPDDNAVAIIASLLSCALDAIGAGAWVASVGNSSSTDASEIIELLYEDTSEALNGFWEARYMRGLLSEFLRFASNLPKSHKPSSEWLEAQGKPFTVAQDVGELPVLPLGAKPDMGIENMKNKAGGRTEERSKREMGTLISRRVPKYSFERIVI